MFSSECLLKELISSDSLLIKILMLTLHGLSLGVPYSVHLLKLALLSRSLPLFHESPSDSLMVYLDQGGGVIEGYWCDSINSVMKGDISRGEIFS